MVEVGSPEDVSLVLKTVGMSRTPFAVLSGGHASNPGFSSTKGVHISLKRFDQVELSADKKIATIGFGLVRIHEVHGFTQQLLTLSSGMDRCIRCIEGYRCQCCGRQGSWAWSGRVYTRRRVLVVSRSRGPMYLSVCANRQAGKQTNLVGYNSLSRRQSNAVANKAKA